ncbi:MAG: bifunctional DNA primase/polymerase [Solirubrobacteraceae bacterium]
MSEMHAAALSYLPRAVPLHAPDAFPAGDPRNGKAPSVGRGWPEWEATPEALRRHYERHPSDNLGVRTGLTPGASVSLVGLDVDPRNGGNDALAELEARHGKLPATPEVATGGGGQHYYFRVTGAVASVDLAPGLELKAEGRQLAAPPSVHADTGRLYVWQPGRPFEPRAIAPLPAWLLPVAREAPRHAAGPQERRDDPLRAISAASYVPDLTGRALDRRGYARCPFHGAGEERTPSLLAGGRDPALRHCFGCGAGGSVYDLVARLAGYALPLRGSAFLVVRDELQRHYALDRQAAT